MRKGQTKDQLEPKVDGWSISSKKAPVCIKKAYKSLADQRQRCTNPNDPRYKWWGAKGIRVEYSAFDFVSWYVEQWKAKGPFKRPNVSRVDHTKNYRFDNIELLECSENSKERIERMGPPSDGTEIFAVQISTGNSLRFKSACEASLTLKVAKSTILSQVNKGPERTIRCGWVFFKAP